MTSLHSPAPKPLMRDTLYRADYPTDYGPANKAMVRDHIYLTSGKRCAVREDVARCSGQAGRAARSWSARESKCDVFVSCDGWLAVPRSCGEGGGSESGDVVPPASSCELIEHAVTDLSVSMCVS